MQLAQSSCPPRLSPASHSCHWGSPHSSGGAGREGKPEIQLLRKVVPNWQRGMFWFVISCVALGGWGMPEVFFHGNAFAAFPRKHAQKGLSCSGLGDGIRKTWLGGLPSSPDVHMHQGDTPPPLPDVKDCPPEFSPAEPLGKRCGGHEP